MHRRLRSWPLAAAAGVLALMLGACSSVPSDSTTPPGGHGCRLLTAADVAQHTNDTATVPCAQRHTAQTFYVGRFPQRLGDAYDTKAQGAFVYNTCDPAFANYVGADDSLVLRIQLSWAWFAPSKDGWEHGARWFRCDLLGGPPGATSYAALPARAKGLFQGAPSNAWLSCARGASFAAAKRISCARPHDWRAVSTIKIGTPQAPYPGDRFSEVRARDYCSDAVDAWLGYVPVYDYAYTYFHKAEWEAGNRRAVCWAKTKG